MSARWEPNFMSTVLDQPKESVTSAGMPAEVSLSAAIRESLKKTGIACFRRLDITLNGDSVIITGKLPSFYFKQLAQAAVMSVPGVESIRNEIHVLEPVHPCG